jgi:hypothetical protein
MTQDELRAELNDLIQKRAIGDIAEDDYQAAVRVNGLRQIVASDAYSDAERSAATARLAELGVAE